MRIHVGLALHTINNYQKLFIEQNSDIQPFFKNKYKILSQILNLNQFGVSQINCDSKNILGKPRENSRFISMKIYHT